MNSFAAVPARASDATAALFADCRVLRDQCEAINGGSLIPSCDGWVVTTIEQSGGYSALLPLDLPLPALPVRIAVEIDIEFGGIGVALVDDHLALLHERHSASFGPDRLVLETADASRVRGLLLRNMSRFRSASRARVGRITFEPYDNWPLAEPSTATTRLTLPLRRYRAAETGSERNGEWQTERRCLESRHVVLVVIDAWATHNNAGWMERLDANVRQRLVPLLQCARAAGIRVIHAAHDCAPHPLVMPASGDIALQGQVSTQSFLDLLHRLATRLVLYAGYSSNMCLLTRPIGLLPMQDRGLELGVVRDASIAMETADTLDGEWMHVAMVNFIETNLAGTLSTDEMITSVNAALGLPT